MSPSIAWSLEPSLLVGVVLAAGVYGVRWRRARASVGRAAAPGWRLASFMGGLVVVLVALVSPVDRLSDQLFAVHMVQHVLLLDVAPILLILGLTRVILRPVTRRLAVVERAAGPLGHPVFAIALYVVVMWAWHVPAMYDAALHHAGIHVVEHLCFAVAGGLYWWHLLSPIRSRLRMGAMGPALYMASTKLLVGVLGLGLAFAPQSLYAFYAHQPTYWGLSPGNSQAAAGLVMALEQSLVMGVALSLLFIRGLAESEREAQRAERFAA